MKQKKIIFLYLLLFVLTACGTKKELGETTTEISESMVNKQEVSQSAEAVFSLPPKPTVATLAVCGDVMSHLPIINDTWIAETESYDYVRLFEEAIPYLAEADYAVGNFETTMAGSPYTGYPTFCAPDELAVGLAEAGFDLMLTANNHCLDKGIQGLYRTLDVMDEVGLAHVGTYRSAEEERIYVADIGGISAAFLGYTYGTNGIPVPENADYAVSLFNTDYMTSLSSLDTDTLLAELSAAKALDTDLIIVLIHWGVEYQTKANAYQQQIADFLIANGADLILGGHAHVPQPIEVRTVMDVHGEERTGFVCYSLGNFISSQNDPLTDTTAILTIELTKDEERGETMVTDYVYQPMMMLDKEGGAERFRLLDIHRWLADEQIEEGLQKKLENTLMDCHEIWGADRDAGNQK